MPGTIAILPAPMPHPAPADPCPAFPTSTTPAKRLRSCLSPTRTPTGGMTPTRPSGSRATSFGSECSMPTEQGWKRTKSVRWEGENEGCVVTSYHATWSATEYDRTPLEPPSAAERTCVLPERGSRTFTTSYDCFDDSGHCSDDFVEPDEMDFVRCMQGGDDHEVPCSPGDEISHESFVVATPAATESLYPPGDECDEEQDRQWEECMERRRMMFAMRSKCDVEDRQPEFEGYRSISAKLVEMLQCIEARRLPSPDEEDEEDDDEEDQHDVSLQLDREEDEERGDGEDDEEPGFRSFASFTFTNLQSLHINPPPCNGGLDSVEEASSDAATETDGENEAATPSLVSSSGSEQDQQLVSPRAGVSPIAPFAHQKERGREREVVLIGAAARC